jgi:NAD(P)-dependent dehydrogenase (short-subunit alcohol dehydrogenase family)
VQPKDINQVFACAERSEAGGYRREGDRLAGQFFGDVSASIPCHRTAARGIPHSDSLSWCSGVTLDAGLAAVTNHPWATAAAAGLTCRTVRRRTAWHGSARAAIHHRKQLVVWFSHWYVATVTPEIRANEPHTSTSAGAVRYDERVAVVTGAGRGMGMEFAILLAARGAKVVINDVRPDDGGPDSAAATARTLVDVGWTAIASDADISDPDSAASVIDLAVETFGRIDIVINNAGNRRFKPFPELTAEDLDSLLDVHVRGAFHLTQRAWPHFQRRRYGRVLNVASADGVVIGVPNHAGYGTCKGALAGLTRELAVEGAPDGIRVNALLPGAATTDGMGAVEGKNYAPPINVTPAVVAPGACWLVHEDCPATGRVFSCSSARMAEVFTRPGAGWQGHPDDFDLEHVRARWQQIESADDMAAVHTIEAWNSFRTALYNQMLESNRQ